MAPTTGLETRFKGGTVLQGGPSRVEPNHLVAGCSPLILASTIGISFYYRRCYLIVCVGEFAALFPINKLFLRS